MPCCTPEVLLSEQSAIAEFPLSLVVSGKVCKGSLLGWSSLSLLFL